MWCCNAGLLLIARDCAFFVVCFLHSSINLGTGYHCLRSLFLSLFFIVCFLCFSLTTKVWNTKSGPPSLDHQIHIVQLACCLETLLCNGAFEGKANLPFRLSIPPVKQGTIHHTFICLVIFLDVPNNNHTNEALVLARHCKEACFMMHVDHFILWCTWIIIYFMMHVDHFILWCTWIIRKPRCVVCCFLGVNTPQTILAGLARTIYTQCMYVFFAGIQSHIRSHTAYIYIRFWPTQFKHHAVQEAFVCNTLVQRRTCMLITGLNTVKSL